MSFFTRALFLSKVRSKYIKQTNYKPMFPFQIILFVHDLSLEYDLKAAHMKQKGKHLLSIRILVAKQQNDF